MRWIAMMVAALVMVGCGAGEEPARRGMGQGAYFDDRPYESNCRSEFGFEPYDNAEFGAYRDAQELAQYRNDLNWSDFEAELTVPDCGLEPGVAALAQDGLDCQGQPDTDNTCQMEKSCFWDVHTYVADNVCQYDVICVTEAVFEEQGRHRPYAYTQSDDYIITDADQLCAGGGVVECSPFLWPESC